MTIHPKPRNLVRGATGDGEIIVGMEIHAQVTSRSKLFSVASTQFGGEPNAHVSLVDAEMPGMLPMWKTVKQSLPSLLLAVEAERTAADLAASGSKEDGP